MNATSTTSNTENNLAYLFEDMDFSDVSPTNDSYSLAAKLIFPMELSSQGGVSNKLDDIVTQNYPKIPTTSNNKQVVGNHARYDSYTLPLQLSQLQRVAQDSNTLQTALHHYALAISDRSRDFDDIEVHDNLFQEDLVMTIYDGIANVETIRVPPIPGARSIPPPLPLSTLLKSTTTSTEVTQKTQYGYRKPVKIGEEVTKCLRELRELPLIYTPLERCINQTDFTDTSSDSRPHVGSSYTTVSTQQRDLRLKIATIPTSAKKESQSVFASIRSYASRKLQSVTSVVRYQAHRHSM